MSNFTNLTRMRIQLALRNKMFFFFSVIFPLGMFFVYSGIFAKGDPRVVSYFLGPVIALNVMGSFWGLSATLVTFREQGILRRFHVTPVSATDMLGSSLLANYALTLPTVFVELALARLVFHVPNLGNLPSLAVLVTVGTVLLIQIFSLACWALLTFFVAAQLFRWEPEAKIPRNAKLWAAATALPFLLLGIWENGNGQILNQAQSAYHSLDQRPSSSSPEVK